MSVAIAITVLIGLVQRYQLSPAKGAQDKGRYAMTYQPYQMPLLLTPR